MDRRAWRATVHGVAESEMTEQFTLSLSHFSRVHRNSECMSPRMPQSWSSSPQPRKWDWRFCWNTRVSRTNQKKHFYLPQMLGAREVGIITDRWRRCRCFFNVNSEVKVCSPQNLRTITQHTSLTQQGSQGCWFKMWILHYPKCRRSSNKQATH